MKPPFTSIKNTTIFSILLILFSGCSKENIKSAFTFSGPLRAETEVIFKNESINATSYFWDFGDGSISAEMNPKHIYKTPGTYTVLLKIKSGSGSEADYKTTVTIGNAYTGFKIEKITINSINFKTPGGADYDLLSNPDMIFSIVKNKSQLIYMSGEYKDISKAAFPVSIYTDQSFNITADNTIYDFVFVDNDGGSVESMGTVTTYGSGFKYPSGLVYPTSVLLQNAQNGIEIKLDLIWY